MMTVEPSKLEADLLYFVQSRGSRHAEVTSETDLLESGLLDSLLLIPPVVLVAAVPVSIAGWGVRENAMIAAFVYAGLPDGDGLLVSVLFGAGSFVIGALGGMAWIFSANRIRLRSLQQASERALDA